MLSFEQLKTCNPHLDLYTVLDSAFQPYGRVLSVPGLLSLSDVLKETEIPETGNRYVASVPALEATEAVRTIGSTVFGGMPIQAGF